MLFVTEAFGRYAACSCAHSFDLGPDSDKTMFYDFDLAKDFLKELYIPQVGPPPPSPGSRSGVGL